MEIPISRLDMSHQRIILVTTILHVLLLIPCTTSMVAPTPPTTSIIMRPNVTNSLYEESAKHGSRIGMEYPQCEWIPVTCQGLGYNMTAMPNLIGHTNLLDAEIMVNVFHLFERISCSSCCCSGQFFFSGFYETVQLECNNRHSFGGLHRSTRCIHCLTSCIRWKSCPVPLRIAARERKRNDRWDR